MILKGNLLIYIYIKFLMKKAFITGVTGQDGSYLSELLLSKKLRGSWAKKTLFLFKYSRESTIYLKNSKKEKKFILHYGDLTDSSNIFNLISKIKPNEIYNLGAQSHVAVSFESPEYTANADALGTLRILEAIKLFKFDN